jgi:hypothetical protein
MAQRKKSRINELSELIAAPVAKIKLVFQSISKPLGSDPDEYVTSQMSAEQRAELKEKQDQDAKKNKGRKGQESEPQAQPKQEPEDEPWVYSHQTEYDQYGAPIEGSTDDIYARMRNDLARDFARSMFGSQRPY